MCGIIGSFNGHREWVSLYLWDVKKRGPDTIGLHSMGSVWFGHTRLSIQDTSDAGTQPMVKDGVMITYNGEVWNTDELTTLIQHKYPGYIEPKCDTELLLDYYLWYCRKDISMLKHINGMIAFGLYDTQLQRQLLFRDIIGEKPLYYTKDGRFCSKQSCLTNHHLFNGQELRQVLERGYPLGPIYDDVLELKPGYIWMNGIEQQVQSFTQIPNRNIYNRFTHTLSESVHRKITHTDVGFVVCVSGGLDSSLLLTEISSQYPNKTIQC